MFSCSANFPISVGLVLHVRLRRFGNTARRAERYLNIEKGVQASSDPSKRATVAEAGFRVYSISHLGVLLYV
jgi:hypothetical protein